MKLSIENGVASISLLKTPKPEDMKVIVWDKVLCSKAEWDGFIKAANEGQARIRELEAENQQLKETLANAIVPKFKIGQEVWCIEKHWNISKGDYYTIEKHEIDWFKVYRISKKQTKPIVAYRIKTYGTGKAYLYYEKDIFATEELAKKRLKELNGGA